MPNPAAPKLALALALGLPAAACAQVEQGPPNTPYEPVSADQTRAPALPATAVTTEVFASGLQNPWGIAPLPDGSFLVTERPGALRLVAADGTVGEPIAGLPEVDARDQGGLLDVTVGADFATDRTVYWSYAKPLANETTATAAARGVLSEDGTEMTEVVDIFVQDPPSAYPMHFGSRVVLDGEGHLIVTTGEHFETEDRIKAQDPMTHYGKVVRLNTDGTAPDDNPFGPTEAAPGVWSLGHRNIQGATLDPSGTLWTIEHGPLGGDELQAPAAGLNYGWPEISYGINYDGSPVGTGQSAAEGFEQPVYYWDPVIAPGGMDFYGGSLFADWQGDLLIGSLQPGGLVRIRMEGGRVTGEERMLPDVGRVRDVEELPDGSLLLLIDASNGEILRVTPGA